MYIRKVKKKYPNNAERVCVCVFVLGRGRERERDSYGERVTDQLFHKSVRNNLPLN